MANRRRNIDFEALYAKGELAGPDGFQSQTVNGTAHWRGTGWNQRWDWEQPEVPSKPTWPEGRSNRTGE